MIFSSQDTHQLAPLRLLLVEDSPTAVELITYCLSEGFPNQMELVTAENLGDCLTLLEQQLFDVVILDLNLPDSSGLDTFRAVMVAAPVVPIVILTAAEDQKMALDALSEGAQDYIFKRELENNSLTRAVLFALERSRRQHVEREISLAEQVQQGVYPAVAPTIAGYRISGRMFPAEQTSGDYFDFIPLADGSMGIVVADVSGHGLGAALMMMQTRAYMRSLTEMWDYVRGVPELEMSLGDVLTHANRLTALQHGGRHFVTLFYAQLHPEESTITYASAGHQGYLIRSNGTCEVLQSTGLVLGIIPELKIPAAEPIQLQPGDILFLPTDGVDETVNSRGDLFGKEKMVEFVNDHQHLSPEEIIDTLREKTSHFRGGHRQIDDWTAIVLKVEENQESVK